MAYVPIPGLVPSWGLSTRADPTPTIAPSSAAPAPTIAPSSVAPAPAPVSAPAAPGQLDSIFSHVESQFPQLPAGLLKALAWQESSFNPKAMGVRIDNPKSAHYGTQAQGMFQFMPATAQQFGVRDPFDPMEAAMGAARKLTADLQRRGGVLGEALLDWYGRGNPPAGQPSPRQYVDAVLQKANSVRAQSGATPAAQLAPTSGPRGDAVVGRTADGTRMVVNGVVFDPSDYSGWQQGIAAAQNGPAPLPPGFQPVNTAEFSSAAQRATTPNASVGGLAKSFGSSVLSSAGSLAQVPAQLALEGAALATGANNDIVVPNPGAWAAGKLGLHKTSLGDQAAQVQTAQAMDRAGKAGSVSEAISALSDVPGAGMGHLAAQAAGFAVPWLLGGAGLKLAGAGQSAIRGTVAAGGGLQGGAISAEQIHQQVMAMDEPTIATAFPQYSQLRANGQTFEAARAMLAHDAAMGGMAGGAAAGALGGAIYAPWIAAAPRGGTSLAAVAGNIPRLLPRLAATSGVGAVAGGMQGALQTAAQTAGANMATDGEMPVTGMAPNVMMGGMGGAMMAGVHGLRRTPLPEAAPKPPAVPEQRVPEQSGPEPPPWLQRTLPLQDGVRQTEMPFERPGSAPPEHDQASIDAEFAARQPELPFPPPRQGELVFAPRGEVPSIPEQRGPEPPPGLQRRLPLQGGARQAEMPFERSGPAPMAHDQAAIDAEFAARQPELPFPSPRQEELFASPRTEPYVPGKVETNPVAVAERARMVAEQEAAAQRQAEEARLIRAAGVLRRAKGLQQSAEQPLQQVETRREIPEVPVGHQRELPLQGGVRQTEMPFERPGSAPGVGHTPASLEAEFAARQPELPFPPPRQGELLAPRSEPPPAKAKPKVPAKPAEEAPVTEVSRVYDRLEAAKVGGNKLQRRTAAAAIVKALDDGMTPEQWADHVQATKSERSGPALIEAFNWAREQRRSSPHPKELPADERAPTNPAPDLRNSHAQEIRSDEGQIQGGRAVERGGETQGREDLQQPARVGEPPSRPAQRAQDVQIPPPLEAAHAKLAKLRRTEDGQTALQSLYRVLAAPTAKSLERVRDLRLLASYDKPGVSPNVRLAVRDTLHALREVIGHQAVDRALEESGNMLSIGEEGPKSKVPALVQRGHDAALVDAVADTFSRDSGNKWSLSVGTRPESVGASAAEVLARLFGKRVVWVHNNNPDVGNFNGLINRDISKGVIFINSTTSRPLMQVLGHELTHHLENDFPQLYASMREKLDAVIGDTSAYERERNEKYAKYNLSPLSKERMRREIIGDVVGDRLDDPIFWKRFAGAYPTVARRVMHAVIDFIDSIVGLFRTGKYAGGKVDSLITDLDRARGIVADTLAVYLHETKRNTSDTGEGNVLDIASARQRIHEDFVPDAGDVQSFAKKGASVWRGAMNKARLWYMNKGAMLGDLTEMAKPYLKDAARFEEVIREMGAKSEAVTVPASYVVNKWGALDRAEKRSIVDISLVAEDTGFRPDKPFDHPSNAYGRRIHGSPAEARAEYDRAVAAYDSAPSDAVREVYAESQELNANVIGQVRDALLKVVRQGINDPMKRADMEKAVIDRFNDAASGRPYNPHMWEGDYVIEANKLEPGPKDEPRVILAFKTKEEANAQAARLDSIGYRTRQFTKRSWMASEVGGGRTLLNGIVEAIDRMGLDPEQAGALTQRARDLYFATMPEVSGARRLMTRTNTPGWSSDYRVSWAKSVQSLINHAARLEHMDQLRDTLEDMGREAGHTQPAYVISSWKAADKSDFSAQIVNSAAERADLVARASSAGRTYHISPADPRELRERLPSMLIEQAPSVAVADKWTAALTDSVTRVEMAHGGKGDTLTAGEYYNAFRSRMDLMLHDVPESTVANVLTNVGYLNYLGFSVPFAFTNLHQVPMVSLPALGASHGYSSALRALYDAMGVLGQNKTLFGKLAVASLHQTSKDSFDVASLKLSPSDEGIRSLLTTLQKYGTLDFTQSRELHALTAGTPLPVERVIRAAGVFAHPTEVFNRALTAIAAYKLKMQETGDHELSVRFARKITDDTQVNYSRANRAPILNSPTARVLLQFRQFGMHMAWLMGRQLHTVFKSADPVERAAALRYLLGMTAMSVVFAGIRGAPFMGTFLLLAHIANSALGDPDSPTDIEHELRQMLGPVLYNGAYRGMALDVANSLGLADILPGSGTTARKEAKLRDTLKTMVFDAAGPSIGMVGNWADGIDFMQNGNTLRAWESFLPRAFKGPFMAQRFATEGLETPNGIVRVESQEFTPVELMAAALGLRLARVAEKQADAGAIQRRELLLGMRAAILRKAYMSSLESGDQAEQQEALADITKFNKANPEVPIDARALNGFMRMHGRSQALAGATQGLAFNKKQLLLANRLGLLDTEN